MSFRSPFPDVEIPDLSVYDYLFGSLDEADSTARADRRRRPAPRRPTAPSRPGRLRSPARSRRAVSAVGDVVGLLCPNVPAFATVFHGILRAGATVTTINSLYTAERDREAARRMPGPLARHRLAAAAAGQGRRGEARHPRRHAHRARRRRGHPNLRDLLTEQRRRARGELRPGDARRGAAVLLGHHRHPQGRDAEPPQPGGERGAVQSALDIDADDRVLAVLPFFHIYGMTVLLNLALRKRASLVTMPKFDLVEFLRIIQKYKCTYLFIAPPIAVALAKHPIVDQYDISSVHTVFSGAAPLDGETARDRRRGSINADAAGLRHERAEPGVARDPAERDDIAGQLGRARVANMECKLVDTETGEEIDRARREGSASPASCGARARTSCSATSNKAEATAETLDADGLPAHRRHRDRGRTRGYFTIVDRAEGAHQVQGLPGAAGRARGAAADAPEITDAAVIGVLDDDGQEIPKAFVVRQPDSGLDEEDVMEFVAEHVAPHKKVRRVSSSTRCRSRRRARSCARICASRPRRDRQGQGPDARATPRRCVRALSGGFRHPARMCGSPA